MTTSAWRRAHAALVALGCAVALVACGGGGGGDGGGNAPAFHVTLDRSSVEFTYDANGPLPQATVRATATGTPPATLYVAAVVEGGGIDPVIPAVITGMNASFTLQPAPGLRAGTYTGRVLLSACSDAACNTRIGGTPLAVNYRVVVRAVLGTEPASVWQRSMGGTAAQQRVAVTLPDGVSSYTVGGLDAAPWLRGSIVAGELVLDFLPWRSGYLSVALEVVTATGRVPLPVTYQVDLPAGGEHDLRVDTPSLTLTTTEGASSEARALTITPASWSGGTMPTPSIRYAEGGPTGWLSATPIAGGLAVSASAAALPQGSYTATLVLTPAAPATVLEVPIALSVGPGLVRPADVGIAVHAETTAAALSGSAAVQVAQGANRGWTATADRPWLRLTNAAGTTGSSAVAWTVDSAALALLDNFAEHAASITITADTPVYTPVSFRVSVDKRLPEVQFLGPHTVVAGRTTRLSVRGRGFLAVADIGARLAAAGLPSSGLTRLSDSELRLDVAPGAEAVFAVGVGNALTLAPATAALSVVPPRSYAYAAIASAGAKRAVVVDAVRQAVYAVNVENETLNRLRFDGSSWVLDAVSVPAILDAGVTPDNRGLIVTATPGTLRLLNPATLATEFTLAVPGGLARNLTYTGYGIASTNDGHSWLPAGDTGWNELLRFDHRTRTLLPRPAQPDLPTSFYGGPWAMVSRDGSTMAVVQSGSISPSPPALVWRASDPLLRINGAGLSFFYEAGWSDDGSRIAIDGYEVRDGDFGLVGRLVLDGEAGGPWVTLGTTVSPDGRRSYVLAYADGAFYGGAQKPVVFVFDSSTRDAATSVLPLVGRFELADYPGCRSFTTGDCPTVRPRMAIAPDGRTLFIAGNERFLVVPVPEALRTAGSEAERRARALRGTTRVQAWPAGGR